MKLFLYLLVFILPLISVASEPVAVDVTNIEKAKAFIKEYPKVNNKLDEAGLVDLWQRIKGLHNLINVWHTDLATLEQSGPDEPQRWRWQIRHRIWSHLIYAKYNGDDEQVKALVAMIRLHAMFADYFIGDEIQYSHYADIAEYAEANGHYLAEQVEKKYSKDANN